MSPCLIVLGDCNPDLIMRGNARPRFSQVETIVDDAVLTIGGSAAITACGAARLGVDTALVAAIGDDALGRVQVEAIADLGVDTAAVSIRRGLTTGVSVILTEPDDRAILTSLGAIGSLGAADVDRELLRKADHVHVGGAFLLSGLREDLPELLGDARVAGATVSVDTNWDPSGAWLDGWLEAVLRQTDVVLPNLAEARLLSGELEPEDAAASLADRFDTAAIKLGPQGAVAASGGERARAAALSVEVADTTGAGDSFNAGFIAASLSGASLAEALKLATVCGSLSTTAVGGTGAQPTLAQARAAIGAGG